MTPAGRTRRINVVLVTLMVATVVVAVGFALMQYPARTAATSLAARDTGMLITPVPTAGRGSLLVPSLLPTGSPANSEFQAASEGPLSGQFALPVIAGPLLDPTLSLLAGPREVPLEMRIPALDIRAPVLGVGLTMNSAMASPIGSRPEDPIWQTVFWYRGGGIPGDVGTATFAGHYDDDIGRPAVFAFLPRLETGDLIVVHDQRTGVEISFIVTELATYTEAETTDPAVLARIFGSSAAGAESVSEPLSRLTLITCGGNWVDGSFELRHVVYAVRASYPV